MKYILAFFLLLSIKISNSQSPIQNETITGFVALQNGPEQNPYDTSQITFVTSDSTVLDSPFMSYPMLKVYTYTIISVSGDVSDTTHIMDTVYFTGNNYNVNMVTYTPHTSQYQTFLKCSVDVSVGFFNSVSFRENTKMQITVINKNYLPLYIDDVKSSISLYGRKLRISSDMKINRIDIFSISGQLINSFNMSDEFIIDDIPPGIYIISLCGDGYRYSKKVKI